jgi:hypothetical protein
MAAIDFDRVPTQVFYTVQRSFAPVCASLEYDRDTWKTGQGFQCVVWAINDLWESVPDASIDWRIINSRAEQQCAGKWVASLLPDSVSRLGEVQWKPISVGAYELHAEVKDGTGRTLSENVYAFEVSK